MGASGWLRWWHALPAGSGVDHWRMALPLRAQCLNGNVYVFAGATAGIGTPGVYQLFQRLLVERGAGRLQNHRFVGYESASAELLQDAFGSARHGTRRIHIFYAHQPLTTVGPRIQPAGQRRYQ